MFEICCCAIRGSGPTNLSPKRIEVEIIPKLELFMNIWTLGGISVFSAIFVAAMRGRKRGRQGIGERKGVSSTIANISIKKIQIHESASGLGRDAQTTNPPPGFQSSFYSRFAKTNVI